MRITQKCVKYRLHSERGRPAAWREKIKTGVNDNVLNYGNRTFRHNHRRLKSLLREGHHRRSSRAEQAERAVVIIGIFILAACRTEGNSDRAPWTDHNRLVFFQLMGEQMQDRMAT